jgi:formylglycine-generating enzyme required for sulfatase activity
MVLSRKFACLLSILLAVWLSLTTSAHAANTKRLALIIGNDSYKYLDPLINARNDAKLISGVLKRAGFEVTTLSDLNRDGFWAAVDSFKNLINKGDEVVFYYAGHGVQISSNQLLLPVDTRAQNDSQVQRDGVALVDVQDALKDARFAMFVIDACRDNPFPRLATRSIGNTRGLIPPEPASGQVIIMSAGRNQRALDSVPGVRADNGLFTYELALLLEQPGLEIRVVLERVKEQVDEFARRVNHDQRPSLVNDLRGDFYFFGPPEVPLQGATSIAPSPKKLILPKTADQIDDEAWDSIKDSGDVASLDEYIKQYPKGRHLAQARIAVTKAKSDAKRVALASPTSSQTSSVSVAGNSVTPNDPEFTFWQAVTTSNTVDDYSVYLQQFPKGRYVPLARQRIQKLEDDIRAKAQAEEFAVWQAAESAQTLEAYAIYEKRYPDGRYESLSQNRVRKIRTEQARQQEEQVWATAQKGDSKAVAYYLERYPAGIFAIEASALMGKLRAEEEAMRPGKEFKECADCPEMVIIPSGTFEMGTGTLTGQFVPKTVISKFAAGKFAVTISQFAAFVRDKNYLTDAEKSDGCIGWNGSTWKKDRIFHWRNVGFSQSEDHPVVCVSWNDAQAYVQWLSQATGKAYRLFTESEREYATRAGTHSKFWWGDAPNRSQANYGVEFCCSPSEGKFTTPVGQYPANPFGLYDMSGNTWDWVEDWQHESDIGRPTNGSAWVVGGEQKYRVLRGGSWSSDPSMLWSTSRYKEVPEARDNDSGFRVARTLNSP